MNKTAIVIGATGLVGSHILKQLLEDDRYETVKVFHRRNTSVEHSKLEEHIVDFDNMEEWKHRLTGDELYSALGTTIKKAGSQEKQYTIDFTYQYETAKSAAENDVDKFSLVSSAGANAQSRAFYTKLKGELDEAVKELPFEVITILRPSFLDGDRSENRVGETIGIYMAKLFTKIPGLKKYRPIFAGKVAEGMINSLHKCPKGYHIFELDEIFYL
ncbi:MAG: NAD(P)H-binding protein [Gracilimonas sp.]|uniref:NAD(P)H-binding protein n=1 Tax=Gracilimonas TaxID=649462 RepID=UPI001B14E9EB|nr:NAD(P)H-binding protein [Gracilimonas sp.]MBO6584940.1 NAD(P)H-binding protein [Gracilimonas sp.]MBO6615789.1 NAD(P)H-binding protein [Gracilimonas sp.]